MLKFLFFLFVYVIITRTIMMWYPYDIDPHPDTITRFIWALRGEFYAIASGFKSLLKLFKGGSKHPADTVKALGLAVCKFFIFILKQAFDPDLTDFTRIMFQIAVTYTLVRHFNFNSFLSVLMFVILFAVQYAVSVLLVNIATDLTWDSLHETDIEITFYFFLCRIYQSVSNMYYDTICRILNIRLYNMTPDEYVSWIAQFKKKQFKRREAEVFRHAEEFEKQQDDFNRHREENKKQEEGNNRQQEEAKNKAPGHKPNSLDLQYPEELKILELYMQDFTMDDLRNKYLELMKRYHPDSNNTTNQEDYDKYTSLSQAINNAYDVISKELAKRSQA